VVASPASKNLHFPEAANLGVGSVTVNTQQFFQQGWRQVPLMLLAAKEAWLQCIQQSRAQNECPTGRWQLFHCSNSGCCWNDGCNNTSMQSDGR